METNFETFKVSEDEEITREKLVSDLRAVAHDAEELLKATAGEMGEKAKEARARLAQAVEQAKVSCDKMRGQAMAGAKATDKVIREHPYQSLAVVFGVGLLLGLVLNRK